MAGFFEELIKRPGKVLIEDPLRGLSGNQEGAMIEATREAGETKREEVAMEKKRETDTILAMDEAELNERKRAGRGRASTILTLPTGLMEDERSARRTLLGS